MKKYILITSLLFCQLSGAVFALEECPDSASNYRNWTNCYGTRTYSNGDQYTGEFKDGEQHGQGTYTYANGTKYDGEWKDGEKL